jgi:hypothetical protein
MKDLLFFSLFYGLLWLLGYNLKVGWVIHNLFSFLCFFLEILKASSGVPASLGAWATTLPRATKKKKINCIHIYIYIIVLATQQQNIVHKFFFYFTFFFFYKLVRAT